MAVAIIVILSRPINGDNAAGLPPPPQPEKPNFLPKSTAVMAQVKLLQIPAPPRQDGATLDEAATQMDLGGIVSLLESEKWIWNPNISELQSLGEFAVKEKNKKASWHLEFKNVYQGWHQRVSGNRGLVYLLDLVAKHDGVLTKYEAYVWVKLDGTKILRSLSPKVLPGIEPSA